MRRRLVPLAAAVFGAACSMNEPTYFPAAGVEVGGGAMGEPAAVELPFRPPREDEATALAAESASLGFGAPWLRAERAVISVLYTITNLGEREALAHLEVDGASEFASYDVVALRAANEALPPDAEETIVLPLITTTPVAVAPGTSVTGTLREDDLTEAALDLDALARFGATPAAVLVNASQLNRTGLEMLPPNHIVPALYRVRVALVGNGHLKLDYLVRVRDEGRQLNLTGAASFAPAPMPYAPPMPMMPMP